MSFYKKIYNEKFGVYYPSAVTVGQPVPVKKVAKRLSQMCTVTYADVMAVLGELPGVMADYMAQGKSVPPARGGADQRLDRHPQPGAYGHRVAALRGHQSGGWRRVRRRQRNGRRRWRRRRG